MGRGGGQSKAGPQSPWGDVVTAGQFLVLGLVLFPLPAPHTPTLGLISTIDFKSVVGFEVTGSHFAHHGKHVQEVVQGHVAIPIFREDLGNPLAKWVVLGTASREVISDQGLGDSTWSHSQHPENVIPPMRRTV